MKWEWSLVILFILCLQCAVSFSEKWNRSFLFRTVCIWVGKGILAKDLYAFMQKFYKLAREFVLSNEKFSQN